MPGPEEQRLDRGLAEGELGRDLAVRKPLPLAQQDRSPLLLGQRFERLGQLPDVFAVGGRGAWFTVEYVRVARDLDTAPVGGLRVRKAHVAGDRQEPCRLVHGDDAATERAERVEEGRLRRVLGLLARP
jgi:hypothetical protein